MALLKQQSSLPRVTKLRRSSSSLLESLCRSGWAHDYGYGGVGPTDYATTTQLGAGLYEAEPNRQEGKTRQELENLTTTKIHMSQNSNFFQNQKFGFFSHFIVEMSECRTKRGN